MRHLTIAFKIHIFIFILTLNFERIQLKSTNIPEEEVERNEIEKENVFGKTEKCDTIKYKQVISKTGCENKTIYNHYCQGQCFSGYVPENGVNGKYICSSCKPSIKLIPIWLECEGGREEFKLEIFSNCRCIKTKCQAIPFMWIKKKVPTTTTSRPPPKPCKNKCRKCRRFRRKYKELFDRQIFIQNLKASCRSNECRMRISEKIFIRAKRKKKQMKRVCRECKQCKKRKKARHGKFST